MSFKVKENLNKLKHNNFTNPLFYNHTTESESQALALSISVPFPWEPTSMCSYHCDRETETVDYEVDYANSLPMYSCDKGRC